MAILNSAAAVSVLVSDHVVSSLELPRGYLQGRLGCAHTWLPWQL